MRRRGRVGNAVRGHDLEHVLLLRQAAAHVRPGRRGGGLGAERRERAFLDARVHVRLVVVADVQHVIVAVDGARQRLDADVGGAAVAGEAHHRAIVGLLALRAQAGLDAGEHAGRGRERRDHRVVGEAELREVEADGAHATRRQRAHRVRPQNLERRAHGQRPAASGARLVAEEELVVSDVLGIDGHGYRPLSDRASADSARDPSAPRCALRSG